MQNETCILFRISGIGKDNNLMSNLERLKNRIAAEELDAVLLLDSYNRHFATGFHSSSGAVIVTANDAWFITDSRYIEAATEFAAGRFNVCLHNSAHPMNDMIKTIMAEQGVSRLGGESCRLSYDEYTKYEELLGIKMIGCQAMLDELRADKEKTKAGITGLEIAARIISECRPYCQGVHIMSLGWESKIPTLMEMAGLK